MSSRNLSLVTRQRLATALSTLTLVLVALAAFTAVVGDATATFAQDLGAGEPAAAAPAAAEPAAAEPAAGDASTDPAASPPTTNLLFEYYDALGLKYTIAFLIMSFAFVAVLVMNFLSLRRDSIVPASLIEGFEAHLNEKRYQDAYELAKADESFLGHVLAAGLAKLSTGYPQAIEAMQEVGEDENMKLEQRLSYVALVGSLAPMLGLLGTVEGMVDSFRVIASSAAQPKPADLAKGIMKSLVTTVFGLYLAIPAIFFYGLLKNRLQRFGFEVGVMSESLMSRFSSVGGKK